MLAIGIDIGGTKIAAGLVRFPKAEVEKYLLWPTPPIHEKAALVAGVHETIEGLFQTGSHSDQKVSAIGIAVCELVDNDGQIRSANAVDLQHSAFLTTCSHVAPSFYEADVRAAALAEAQFGVGKHYRSFVYLTIGTGVSCALVIEGKPYTGEHGFTGTAGSSPLPGTATSLEELASGPALVRRYGNVGSAVEVLNRAQEGDAAARDIVTSAASAAGATVGLLINTLDPGAVILGGGLGLAEGLYWQTLVSSARRHIWSPLHRDIPILQAQTGEKAGVIGAALYALQKTGRCAQ